MEVKSLRLSNGQEVITRIKEDGDKFILNKPLVLNFTPQGMGFAPLMFTSNEEEFVIDASKIDIVSVTSSEIESQYLEAVSGLSLSSKNSGIQL